MDKTLSRLPTPYRLQLCPCCGLPFPSAATDAQPGSYRKIEVMRGRAEQGVCLYHPDDEQELSGRCRGSPSATIMTAVLMSMGLSAPTNSKRKTQ